MSVGYATINSISFDFEGIVHAEKQEGIFITDYQCQNNINENPNVSESPISYYSKIGNGYAKITYLRKKET